jgi:hypothetical protein
VAAPGVRARADPGERAVLKRRGIGLLSAWRAWALLTLLMVQVVYCVGWQHRKVIDVLNWMAARLPVGRRAEGE